MQLSRVKWFATKCSGPRPIRSEPTNMTYLSSGPDHSRQIYFTCGNICFMQTYCNTTNWNVEGILLQLSASAKNRKFTSDDYKHRPLTIACLHYTQWTQYLLVNAGSAGRRGHISHGVGCQKNVEIELIIQPITERWGAALSSSNLRDQEQAH